MATDRCRVPNVTAPVEVASASGVAASLEADAFPSGSEGWRDLRPLAGRISLGHAMAVRPRTRH